MRRLCSVLLGVGTAVGGGLAFGPSAGAGPVVPAAGLVSVTTTGSQPSTSSMTWSMGDISDDGRYVLFETSANGVVAGDTNGQNDIFVRDRQGGTTTRVSFINNTPGISDGGQYGSLSGNGRFVTFDSNVQILPADTDPFGGAYQYDRVSGSYTLISADSAGEPMLGNHTSSQSDDGSVIAFTCNGTTAQPATPTSHICVRAAGVTTIVTASANSASHDPKVSGDGTVVVFASEATNLVGSDLNAAPDVFAYSLGSGAITRVSVATNGTEANGHSGVNRGYSVSDDGRFVVFDSAAGNLVANDATPAAFDVFLRDRQAGTTTLVSVSSTGAQGGSANVMRPAISGNGRFVTFVGGEFLPSRGGPDGTRVWIRDLQTGRTALVSRTDTALSHGDAADLSDDGSVVVFQSRATNLLASDANGAESDLFVAVETSPGQCNGLDVTVDIGSGELPTEGADVVLGTPGADQIDALGGNDVVCGGGISGLSDEVLHGGAGQDVVIGNRFLYGDDGNDILVGQAGDDVLQGGEGNDYLFGGGGVDLYFGDGGNDILDGGGEGETMDGGVGDDVVVGAAGDDTLRGGDGADYLLGQGGVDSYDGGFGPDWLDGDDEGEVMSGGDGDDVITGGGGDDTLFGDDGRDYLLGEGGVDLYEGGGGADHLDGGVEGETMNGGRGDDVILGGGGADILFGDPVNDAFGGGDYLLGGAGVDVFHGGSGNDYLDGGDEGETMNGDLGNDIVLGGAGDDTLFGESAAETLTGGGDYLLGGPGVDTYDGGSGDDYLDGGDEGEVMDGGRGHDTVVGGGGADDLRGGDGFDYLLGQGGVDTFSGGRDADYLDGGAEGEVMDGGGEDDVILGRGGADDLRGSDGSDYLAGEEGNDALDGGSGVDTCDGGVGTDTGVRCESPIGIP